MLTLNCKGKIVSLKHPIVMGVINTTPDSFYQKSQLQTIDACLFETEKMLNDGASIIDIGGQSTQPNSKAIDANEELNRVVPIIDAIHQNFSNCIISIDTYYATVAQHAIQAGASMVNDISGGALDKTMLATVAKYAVPYICMHMQGTPQTMQAAPHYTNITKEILSYFIERISTCTNNGINDVIVDVGFGFGKTPTHNFELLKKLNTFKILQKPILIGVSRKSTIYKTLGITANEALNGTTVLNTIALLNGASILRVHDVKEAMECVTLFKAYQQHS